MAFTVGRRESTDEEFCVLYGGMLEMRGQKDEWMLRMTGQRDEGMSGRGDGVGALVNPEAGEGSWYLA